MDPAAQDADANDLFAAFDFTQQPLPPLVLPTRTCPVAAPKPQDATLTKTSGLCR
jgi:hypothetical protein